MKNILIIGTGGTISSTDSGEGLESTLTVEDILSYCRKDLEGVEFRADFSDLMNIDSTLVQPEDWVRMAEEVAVKYDRYDGFVVSHGTDTLAYTASMLAFMLRSPGKPVVLTGSMKPVHAEGSDALTNITDAVRFAVQGAPGVFVAFNGKIIRACRVCKVASMDVDAFVSVNEPPVATMAAGKINYSRTPVNPSEPFSADTRMDPRVLLLKIVPGFEPAFLDAAVKSGVSGLVIESFGAGGLPYRGRDLLEAVSRIAAKLPVVITSQVIYDGVDLQIYEVGQRALKAGVISAGDMTTEAAVTKLMWVLGHTGDREEVARLFRTSMAGEITL